MIFMLKIAPESLLKDIPDFTNWAEAQKWIEDQSKAVAALSVDEFADAEFACYEWKNTKVNKSYFGLYSSEEFRKFVLATYFADLICYASPPDQVHFDRLLFVMHAFPQGFKTWWIKPKGKSWMPAGYSGWYPMHDTMYETFANNPEKLTSRMVVPNVQAASVRPLIYLFNFSVIPYLKHTPLSKALMHNVAADIKAQNPKGLACITVSEDGIAQAQRFKMTCSGHLIYDQSQEGVWVTK